LRPRLNTQKTSPWRLVRLCVRPRAKAAPTSATAKIRIAGRLRPHQNGSIKALNQSTANLLGGHAITGRRHELFTVRNSCRPNVAAKLDGPQRTTRPTTRSCIGIVPWRRVGHAILISKRAPKGTLTSGTMWRKTTKTPSLLRFIASPTPEKMAGRARDLKRTLRPNG
jgi:hypothetical protein